MMAERCAGCHGKGAPTMAEFDKDKEAGRRR